MSASAVVIGVLALGWAGAAAAGENLPLVKHQNLRCVVAGSYPWIEAQVAAEPGIASVQVRFHASGSRAWYSVRLFDDGEQWAGALPRPTARAASFVYVVEVTDAAAHTARTPEATVRVVADPGACGSDGVGPSVPEATVAVLAPPHSPALPRGFDSGESTAPGEAKVGVLGLSAHTSLLASLGVGAAATGVALAVSRHVPSQPEVGILSANPPPGSTLFASNLHLSVRVRVVSTLDIAAGDVVVALGPAGGDSCVTLMDPHHGLNAGDGVELTVATLFPFLPCQPPFSIDEANVTVRDAMSNELFNKRLPLRYSVVP